MKRNFLKKTIFKHVRKTISTTQYKRRRECRAPVQDTNTAQSGNQAEVTISQRIKFGIYIHEDFFFKLQKSRIKKGTGKRDGTRAKLIYNHHFIKRKKEKKKNPHWFNHMKTGG